MRIEVFLAIVNNLIIISASGVKCPKPFFGPDCKLTCHCRKNGCDDTGNCLPSSGCQAQRFGPYCQYVTAHLLEGPEWLTDNDDTTCNPDSAVQSINFKVHITFTWARMVFNASDSHEIVVSFGPNKPCIDQTFFIVDNETTDIYCNDGEPSNQLFLSGNSVGFLCNIIVSAGRNIALRQNASITSTYDNSHYFDPSFAVDGKRGLTVPASGIGCVHSSVKDMFPQFTLSLNRPYLVHTVKLFGRPFKDFVVKRLMNFRLLFFSPNNTLLLEYEDQSTASSLMYTVQLPALAPVGKVIMVPRVKESVTDYEGGNNEWNSINFCEIELYGETICENNKYGFACQHTCDFCYTNICYAQTGACRGPCRPGKRYLGCEKECKSGHYGFDCSSPCGPGCLNETCDVVTGVCDSCKEDFFGPFCKKTGCKDGTYGPHCEQKCPYYCEKCDEVTGECICELENICWEACHPTSYGPYCSLKCSNNCTDNVCDPVSGACLSCIPGHRGALCDEACKDTFYGKSCSLTCPKACLNGLCHTVSGACLKCPPHHEGIKCDVLIPEDSSKSILSRILVGVICLVGVLLVFKMFTKKRRPGCLGMHVENEGDIITKTMSKNTQA